jgi:hypothetical protein
MALLNAHWLIITRGVISAARALGKDQWQVVVDACELFALSEVARFSCRPMPRRMEHARGSTRRTQPMSRTKRSFTARSLSTRLREAYRYGVVFVDIEHADVELVDAITGDVLVAGSAEALPPTSQAQGAARELYGLEDATVARFVEQALGAVGQPSRALGGACR